MIYTNGVYREGLTQLIKKMKRFKKIKQKKTAEFHNSFILPIKSLSSNFRLKFRGFTQTKPVKNLK